MVDPARFGFATRLHAVAAPLLLLVGCAMPRGTAEDAFEERAAAEEIEILVRNNNFSQVTVYTARAGSGRRLGIVPGKGEATFKVRWTLPDIRLRVRPLAGREFYTETLSVAPGELLELVIPPR
ncbi:MAG: hypothetical protein F4087_15090 [Gemmatimonadetes bacterium]|nr:hypothetical protein [Gemmatimonadota bacterium]MYE70882.1 hypothetical protein [Gemmatimonadota bacterium]MYJ69812.1 hypothetical protein [Gemmatimonadota bacterium]